MATESKNRKPAFTVKRGNVKVPGYSRKQTKNGTEYTNYLVPDYSAGRRKVWTFADFAAAKTKAAEVAEATASGRTEVLQWEDDLRVEIRKSLDNLQPTGLTLLPACSLFTQAVNILGGTDDLLAACQH
ncbi:MAG: hypothetical protein KGS61_15460 [Verrucomicrobia bacterium]|nr:hypothetical protein [Verrucomicrobiota bacterium]